MEPKRSARGEGEHGDWLDLLAAVALGSATREERDAVAAHLVACPICRAAAPRLRSAVDALPLGLPDQEPPPGMRSRMEARLAGEIAATAPWEQTWGRPTPLTEAGGPTPAARPSTPRAPSPGHATSGDRSPSDMARGSRSPGDVTPALRPARPRRFPARVTTRFAAALAAAVLVAALLGGMAAWNLRLRSQLDDRPRVEVIMLVAQQGSPGVTATSSYVPDRDVLLVALHDAPQLGPGQVYQLWLVQGEAVIPFGIFDRGSGESAVVADPADYDAIVVTTEPAPFGSGSATTAPLLVAAIEQG